MSDGLSRRAVLARTATGAGIMLSGSFSGLFGAGASPAAAAGRGKPGAVGYGPLSPIPTGLLSLPEGFSYTIVARVRRHDARERRADAVGPRRHGGVPCRHGGNGTVLVNNHEVGGGEPYPVPRVAGLRLRPGRRRRHDQHRGRQATATASASTSASPARTTTAPAARRRGTPGSPARRPRASPARPSRTATSSRSTPTTRTPTATRSRSRRSAATRTRRSSSTRDAGTIYLTEDAGTPNGLLYRWTPPARALPLGKGVAARARRRRRHARGAEGVHAARRARPRPRRSPTEPGTTLPRRVGRRCRTATPRRSRRASSSPTTQITRSRKLEGMWWGDGGAYFVGSFARFVDGSAAQHDGQVWFLDPRRGHDRAQAALRLHAGRPGQRPRRPRQHHGLAPTAG